MAFLSLISGILTNRHNMIYNIKSKFDIRTFFCKERTMKMYAIFGLVVGIIFDIIYAIFVVTVPIQSFDVKAVVLAPIIFMIASLGIGLIAKTTEGIRNFYAQNH